jgi:hypothetical protein
VRGERRGPARGSGAGGGRDEVVRRGAVPLRGPAPGPRRARARVRGPGPGRPVSRPGGSKPAAYVLGMLRYDDAAAAGYIRQVEGVVDENNATTEWTNRECERCRAQDVDAVREVTWNVAAVLPVALPDDNEGCRCTDADCGAPQGCGATAASSAARSAGSGTSVPSSFRWCHYLSRSRPLSNGWLYS